MSNHKTKPIENKLSDWKIMRRKGRMVRYQNMVTAEWDGWQMDPDAPRLTFAEKVAVNESYGQGKSLMGYDPNMSGLLLEQMTTTTLKALADTQGVSYNSRTRKSELIAALS